jgi:hypothetical protein
MSLWWALKTYSSSPPMTFHTAILPLSCAQMAQFSLGTNSTALTLAGGPVRSQPTARDLCVSPGLPTLKMPTALSNPPEKRHRSRGE